MSTQIEFKWKPGELKTLYVGKVKNGFMVSVLAGDAAEDYVFASWADALQLMSECFCWDVAPTAEPAPDVPTTFPSTFLRFDVEHWGVRAVFREMCTEVGYDEKHLAGRINALTQTVSLAADELAEWHAVLAELRAREASVAKTEPTT